MINKSSIIFLILLFCRALTCQGQVIIPSSTDNSDKRLFQYKRQGVTVYAEDSTATYLSLLIDEVVPHIQMCDAKEKADLCFVRNPACPPEGYTLHITPDNIKIEAADNAGFTYSVQTLRQWVQTGPDGEILFQCVDIVDAPRIKWRSFMLDSGRQYQSPATIKKYIDMASPQDELFPLASDRRTWLACRNQTISVADSKRSIRRRWGRTTGILQPRRNQSPCGLCRRTQYHDCPRNRHARHAEAALHSYPELGCFNRPVEIPKLGFTPNIFCAGKKIHCNSSKRIRRNMHLVPLSYIHLGGDEAPKDNWNKCPDCQKESPTWV